MGFQDILDGLKEEDRVRKMMVLKQFNESMVRCLIKNYELGIEAKRVAQKFGFHVQSIENYYKRFGELTESEFNDIKNLCCKKRLFL